MFNIHYFCLYIFACTNTQLISLIHLKLLFSIQKLLHNRFYIFSKLKEIIKYKVYDLLIFNFIFFV